MPIETKLNLTVGILIAFVAFLFLVGYTAGRLGRKPFGIVLFVVIVTVILLSAGLFLYTKIDLLALGVVVLPTIALDLGMVSGYLMGRGNHTGTPQKALTALLLVLLIADLSGAYAFYRHLVNVATEIGVVKDTPPEAQQPEAAPTPSSAQNLKELYNAFNHYADSNEGSLPAADKWMENEGFYGYIEKDEWLHDPAVSTGHDEKFGYAYNDAVAGKKLKDIPNPAATPLLYESSNLAKSAHDAMATLPKPGRHNGKNEILYCDGHVAAVAPK